MHNILTISRVPTWYVHRRVFYLKLFYALQDSDSHSHSFLLYDQALEGPNIETYTSWLTPCCMRDLIVQTAKASAAKCDTVLVEDDTDLLALLSYKGYHV